MLNIQVWGIRLKGSLEMKVRRREERRDEHDISALTSAALVVSLYAQCLFPRYVILIRNRQTSCDVATLIAGRMTLLNGIQPRIMWISIGGFVFFGAYEVCKGIVGNVVGSRKREEI